MQINKDTQLIGRFHTDQNGTGLNIYNPYFQDQDIDAIYTLFQNANVAPLINGMRNLGLVGAITAGFEHDDALPKLLDKFTRASEVAGRVGVIANRDGVLTGHYQGGEGLRNAIQAVTDTTKTLVVVVGAGTVAKTLIHALLDSEQCPLSISIYNRTPEHGRELQKLFPTIKAVEGLDMLSTARGDVLINASRIGSTVTDEYFTEEVVARFATVADVTFGSENTKIMNFSTTAA